MTPGGKTSDGSKGPKQPEGVESPGLRPDPQSEDHSAFTSSVPDSGNEEPAAEVVEEDLEQILSVARHERDEYLDMLRRVQADFENYKKRMMRQQTELLERAAQQLVEKLLPALDAFELARTHLGDAADLSDEGKALLQASALLFDSLAKEGLERTDDLGQPFDPTTQEAVEHDTTPVEPGASAEGVEIGGPESNEIRHAGPVVVGVLRPGYRWKGRVIRPAMVKVRG
jgi:molecular chaperone GrpE